MINKKMHVAIIYDGVPNSETGGGAFCVFSLSKSLRQMGNNVTALLVIDKKILNPETERRLKIYQSVVDSTHIVFTKNKALSFFDKIINKFSFTLGSLYPEVGCADEVRDVIQKVKPDVVFVFHFQALAAAYKIKDVPKITIVGDPPFSVMKYRFLFFLKRLDLKHIFLLPFYPILYFKNKKFTKDLLNSCEKKGAVAYHHAQEFDRLGAGPCKYYPIPISDLIGIKNNFDCVRPEKKKFKILLLGHLKGIVAVTGMALFAEVILPILSREIGEDNLEVSIVGSYFDDLPNKLRKKLMSNCVKVKGHLEVIDEEFFSSDVFLVPTPIRLGIRVRIITAMSYGSLIVAHAANKSGIPELEDGENCLLSSSGEELAQKIIDCYNNKYNISKIRTNARATFEKYFEASRATAVIVDDLKKMID